MLSHTKKVVAELKNITVESISHKIYILICIQCPFLLKGVVVNRTISQCTIPDNVTHGNKAFTVKVVKDNVDSPTADLQIEIYDATVVKISGVTPAEFLTETPAQLTLTGELKHSL